ncbi:DUF3710 domain-containing protein, partial [Mycobacterium tuberculosis subsp. tuberculosis]|nr:DUF3710 domain-containing protein [Mycobacterium tuberculosis subsp. tuberculosis]
AAQLREAAAAQADTQRQAAAGVARRGAQGSAMQQLRSTTGG